MNTAILFQAFLRHFLLCGTAVTFGAVFAVGLGISLATRPKAAAFWLSLTSAIQTIPSLALYGLLLPVLGIGLLPAVTVLFFYSLTPILRSTLINLRQIDPVLLESAKGLGLNRLQMLRWVQLPLALPGILAGVRLASMYIISWATLAAFIGAGGLGDLVLAGIYNYDYRLILAGSLPAVVLAACSGLFFSYLIRRCTVPGGNNDE